MLDAVLALLDELELDRPHMAGNSLGGRLALEAAVAGRAGSVTALSPAGFWTSEREARYARANFRVMQRAGRLLEPLAPALSRSTFGRALAYGTIVSRPSRMSPEQALGDMHAFLAASDALNAILAELTQCADPIAEGIPVTIAWGTRDRLLPQRQVLVAKALLPHARFLPLR